MANIERILKKVFASIVLALCVANMLTSESYISVIGFIVAVIFWTFNFTDFKEVSDTSKNLMENQEMMLNTMADLSKQVESMKAVLQMKQIGR